MNEDEQKLMSKEEEKVFLPANEEEFDRIIDLIMANYAFTDRNHVMAVVARTILHLPNDQNTTTLGYLAACVRKNLANFIANIKGQRLKHESDVLTLVNKLTTNPDDQQAYDELSKMAENGSPKAKAALESFHQQPDPTDGNVVPFQGA